MQTFSITQLEQFSGIKAHTIRMWENRFSLLQPARTDTKLRVYNLEDFQRILNIALLNQAGVKISHLVSMGPEQIENKIRTITDQDFRHKNAVNQLLVCMYAADFSKFQTTLDDSVLFFGISDVIRRVIIPFMEKINLLSYNDHGTQTHFVAGCLRNKLITGIEKADPVKTLNMEAILLLPEGAHYDLILLYISYLLKESGVTILYLGTNIPFAKLHELKDREQPYMVVTYLPVKTRYNPSELCATYGRLFPQSKIVITGPIALHNHFAADNCHQIHYSRICDLIH